MLFTAGHPSPGEGHLEADIFQSLSYICPLFATVSHSQQLYARHLSFFVFSRDIPIKEILGKRAESTVRLTDYKQHTKIDYYADNIQGCVLDIFASLVFKSIG